MNLNRHDAETYMELNMTPMIDVVFLLIIFFLLITDLTQKDLEDLVLPLAKSVAEDTHDPGLVRPILNIPRHGSMILEGEANRAPETGGDDMTVLERYLSDQARQMPWVFDAEVAAKLPNDPLIIRADENTEFKYIQRIREICRKKGIQISAP